MIKHINCKIHTYKVLAKYLKCIAVIIAIILLITFFRLNYNKLYVKKINKNIFKNSNSVYNLLNFNRNYTINYLTTDYLVENGVEGFNFSFNINDIKTYKNHKYGVAINKSNLRFLPTDEIYYNSDKNFDLLQNSEIKFNELVIVLFEYQNWYFVQCYNANGWIKKNDIAFFKTKNEFKKYFNNKQFVIVTNKNIIINNIFVDMGVKINFIDKNNDSYILQIPVKNYDGFVNFIYLQINKNGLNQGYLKYNRKNLLNQAYKYLNTKYSWGGSNNGIDCSGFVLNVFNVFGIKLPRNSVDQQKSTGNYFEIPNNFTIEERIKLLKDINIGSLLYFKGHIMIYIGFIDNKKPQIIHSLAYCLDKTPISVVITDLNIRRKNQITFLESLETITYF